MRPVPSQGEKNSLREHEKIVSSSQYEVRGALNDVSSNYAGWSTTVRVCPCILRAD